MSAATGIVTPPSDKLFALAPPTIPVPVVVPKTNKNLYLIRHGESMYNVKDNYSKTHPREEDFVNTRLTPRGKQHSSTLLGDADLLIVSPLRRTLQTYAESSLKVGRVCTTSLVREQVQTWSDRLEHESEAQAPYETYAQLQLRALTAIDFVRQQPETDIIILSHGLFLHAFCYRLTGQRIMLRNAQVLALRHITL